MNELNHALVRTRAAEIRAAVSRLEVLASLGDAEFFADDRNLYSVQFLLLVAIEAASALCGHVLARTALIAPASYGECFEGLRDIGVLDEDLADRLRQMARFRNLLVHRYWEVDPARVLDYARRNLGDFEAYLAAIDRRIAIG
jgi:uncharacterized protein YutE (UPF0331/DUF86 family)